VARQEKGKRWVRGALSLWLCFHVGALFIVPNSTHYITGRLQWLLEPYVNFLEMDAIWSFFAPEPGPPPVFVEYEALDASGGQLSRGFWPEPESRYFWRERQNRRIALGRYMTSAPQRADRLMGVFLCRRNPKAQAIRMWTTMYQVASLPAVAKGDATVKSDSIQKRTWIGEQDCGRGAP